MKTEITITRYNVLALLGWAGLVLGLVAAALHYAAPTSVGVAGMCVGLIGGGLTVTFAGPVRTVVKREGELRRPSN